MNVSSMWIWAGLLVSIWLWLWPSYWRTAERRWHAARDGGIAVGISLLVTLFLLRAGAQSWLGWGALTGAVGATLSYLPHVRSQSAESGGARILHMIALVPVGVWLLFFVPWNEIVYALIGFWGGWCLATLLILTGTVRRERLPYLSEFVLATLFCGAFVLYATLCCYRAGWESVRAGLEYPAMAGGARQASDALKWLEAGVASASLAIAWGLVSFHYRGHNRPRTAFVPAAVAVCGALVAAFTLWRLSGALKITLDMRLVITAVVAASAGGLVLGWYAATRTAPGIAVEKLIGGLVMLAAIVPASRTLAGTGAALATVLALLPAITFVGAARSQQGNPNSGSEINLIPRLIALATLPVLALLIVRVGTETYGAGFKSFGMQDSNAYLVLVLCALAPRVLAEAGADRVVWRFLIAAVLAFLWPMCVLVTWGTSYAGPAVAGVGVGVLLSGSSDAEKDDAMVFLALLGLVGILTLFGPVSDMEAVSRWTRIVSIVVPVVLGAWLLHEPLRHSGRREVSVGNG